MPALKTSKIHNQRVAFLQYAHGMNRVEDFGDAIKIGISSAIQAINS